jgi:glycosyltransferase involved in cell wall biosynthesis
VDPLRILTLTGLFPNSVEPRHGVFVAERLRQLTAAGDVTAQVIAPVPWFPFADQRFGRYGGYARVPRAERIAGFDVTHPRWLAPPGGGLMHPFLLAAALGPAVRAACRGHGAAAVIDSHFLYPDGVAAWLLGKRLGVPTVLTARGSDVNVHARQPGARELVQRAIAGAARVIAVADSLRDSLLALGAPPERVVTIRNGVDLDRFRPVERAPVRERLGLHGPVVLCVGNLLPVKDHALAIETVAGLPDVTLLIAGEGPERSRLEAFANTAGLGHRLRLLGNRSQAELVELYAAADVLLLPSRSEGMPNVVLEALACGLPVVATAVGGVPEVLPDPAAGRVVPERTPEALRAAVSAVLASPPSRASVRSLATALGWGPSVAELKTVLNAAAGRAAS